MSLAEDIRPASAVLPELSEAMASAVREVDTLFAYARANMVERVVVDGRISSAAVELEQHAVHGLAWLATYAETLRNICAWHDALLGEGRLTELEQLIAQLVFGEYLNHIAGGIPMNGQEFIRLHELAVPLAASAKLQDAPCGNLLHSGSTPASRARLAGVEPECRRFPHGASCNFADAASGTASSCRRMNSCPFIGMPPAM